MIPELTVELISGWVPKGKVIAVGVDEYLGYPEQTLGDYLPR